MGRVPEFHTDSDDYPPEDELVYHDNDECGCGNRIKRDGNEVVPDPLDVVAATAATT